MTTATLAPESFLQLNKRLLSVSSLIALTLYLGAAVWLFFNGKLVQVGFLLGVPVALVAIAFPRLALLQFVVCLTLGVTVVESIPLALTDCSALLVVLSALLDLLSGRSLPKRVPPLVWPMVLLTGVIAVSAVAGYNPANGVATIIKQCFLIVLLGSIVRLVSRTGIVMLVKSYLFVVAMLAIPAAMPYIASGGTVRSFGLSPATFDDIAMFALPIALVLFLWTASAARWVYLAAGLLGTMGLFATQSRAPIVFCTIGSLFAVFVSFRSAGRMQEGGYSFVRRRVVAASVAAIVALVGMIVVAMPVIAQMFVRFNYLIDGRLGETVYLRATLWKAALTAFLDHPILGIGAGSFRSIKEMYPGLQLDPVYFWVRGFSAHNLFLHYLAETGIIGGALLISLFWKVYAYPKRVWKHVVEGKLVYGDSGLGALALYVIGAMLLITTCIDAGWLWGQTSYVFVFFAALVSRLRADAEPVNE
jgi:O-antigen ligase